MPKFISNGWEIYFHPQLFGIQYQELFDRVYNLRLKLPEAEFTADCLLSEVHRKASVAAPLRVPLHKRSDFAVPHAAASRCNIMSGSKGCV